MATQINPHKLSFDEYLELERSASTKSEYRGGEMFSMAGGSEPHSRLITRVIGKLEMGLGRSCRIYDSNLKIYAEAVNESLYPDASLLWGESVFYPGPKDVLLNPTMIFEVLSPSTRDYDLGLKASFYRTIPSLEQLIFVDSERIYVQRQMRQAGTWILEEWTSLDSVIPIREDLTFRLRDLYEGILVSPLCDN